MTQAQTEALDVETLESEAVEGFNPAGFISEQEQDEEVEVKNHDPLRVLEALLFASTQPLTVSAIRERLPEGVDVSGLLEQLKGQYSERGVNLFEVNGAWAFRTPVDIADAIVITKDVQRKLSRSAMETLAIIAYHQPITRTEIETIRGIVTSKGMLDILMECGWIKPGKRRETPGRPVTWVTTTEFLDHFGLSCITDLPGLDELKASGLLDRRPAIETVGGTGDLFADSSEEEIEDDLDDSDLEDEESEEGDEVEASAEGEDESEESDEESDDESDDEESDEDDEDDSDEDDEDDESDDDEDDEG